MIFFEEKMCNEENNYSSLTEDGFTSILSYFSLINEMENAINRVKKDKYVPTYATSASGYVTQFHKRVPDVKLHDRNYSNHEYKKNLFFL